MNIVHPGDHVYLRVAGSSELHEGQATLEERLKELREFLPPGVRVTWVPIGSHDSEPTVLFVIRQQ
jgi:hypothetical protein